MAADRENGAGDFEGVGSGPPEFPDAKSRDDWIKRAAAASLGRNPDLKLKEELGIYFISRAESLRRAFALTGKGGLDVDSVLQEALLKIWAALPEMLARNVARPDAYCLQIIRNVFYDNFRRPPNGGEVSSITTGPDGQPMDLLDVTPDAGSDPAQALISREQEALIRESVQQVLAQCQNKRYSDCLRLFYLEGKSGAEIAELLGVSRNAVYLTLRRAVEWFKQAFRQKYIELFG